MRERWKASTIPLVLAAGAFALAFAQRPGLAVTDTKIDLYVSPGRFLADAASTWGSSGDLGHVQGGQTSGYLFPMGPFFALGHGLGLSPWVLQRLWLGTLLAFVAWGVVRLLDALLDRPRGVAHLVAGATAMVNPFVVIYANRTTVTLLASAVLPWLLLVVHRGLREPRRWRWAAGFALLVTASGGGVNGAVTFFMLLAPAMLLVYEAAVGGVTLSAVRSFALRAVPATLLVSLWWLIPAYIQSGYGTNEAEGGKTSFLLASPKGLQSPGQNSGLRAPLDPAWLGPRSRSTRVSARAVCLRCFVDGVARSERAFRSWLPSLWDAWRRPSTVGSRFRTGWASGRMTGTQICDAWGPVIAAVPALTKIQPPFPIPLTQRRPRQRSGIDHKCLA